MTSESIVTWSGTDLEPLSDYTAQRLRSVGTIADYAPGDVVLHEGAPTPFLGLIRSGRVGLRLPVPERGPQTLVTIEPGELLGWSAVAEPFRATADAVALAPTRIQQFDAPRVRQLLTEDCDLASELLPIVLRCVSDRLATSWQQLLDLFAARNVEPW